MQNDGAPGTEDEPGTPGWALYVEPAPGETVIRKATDDGFEGTDLGDILATRGIRRLAVSGLLSVMCVSATAAVATRGTGRRRGRQGFFEMDLGRFVATWARPATRRWRGLRR